MARRSDSGGRLDDAARAGWLYYVAGRTQDEIAAAMGISRQSAQRLVSLAVAERLIKVRLDHPIAACLEKAEALRERFSLKHVEVVPSDPAGTPPPPLELPRRVRRKSSAGCASQIRSCWPSERGAH